jgi:hypothetical protein
MCAPPRHCNNPVLRILLPVLCLVVASHARADTTKLLFKSGFERGVVLQPLKDGYQMITGTDAVTGFTWPIDILGASESGIHVIRDDSGRALENEIRTVTGHTGRRTRVLYSRENHEYRDDTQAPYEILDITDGRRDLYIRYWVKLDSAAWNAPRKWRTFFEWKSRDYRFGTGFRLISFIYTDGNGQPYWVWQGDRDPEHPLWEIENRTIPVPRNTWFLTEFYWHWSTGADGRALWRINGRVVGDHYGPTTRNNKPVDFIMLTQIYGNGNPKRQWIDDIEIRDGLPTD